MRIRLFIAAMVLVPVLIWAQEPAPRALPASLTTDTPRTRIGVTTEESHVTVGFRASTAYDDNVLSSRVDHVSDMQYLLAPEISIQEIRERVTWNLGYAAGVSAYKDGTIGRGTHHSLTGSLDWKPTRRWFLHLRQDYMHLTDAFGTIDRPVPPLGIVNGPNDTILPPASVITSLTSGAEVRYAVSQYGTFGVSGTFIKRDYSDIAGGSTATFLPGQTTTGSAYYSHQYGPRKSVGLQYVFSDMSFATGDDRVQTHSMFVFHSFGFGPHAVLTLYGGPELTQSRRSIPVTAEPSGPSLLIRDSGWSPAFGATYSWSGTRTIFAMDASRRMSDGAGMMRAATVTSGAISIDRQLTRRLSVRSSCRLADNESLDLFSNEGTLKSLIATVGFSRTLVKGFDLGFGYTRVYQDGTGTSMGLGNHNRAEFSLRYSFTHPLGK